MRVVSALPSKTLNSCKQLIAVYLLANSKAIFKDMLKTHFKSYNESLRISSNFSGGTTQRTNVSCLPKRKAASS